MEVERNASLSFIGVEVLNLATRIKTKLKYPKHLFNLAVKKFVDSKVADQQHIPSTDTTTPPSELSYHLKIRSLLM